MDKEERCNIRMKLAREYEEEFENNGLKNIQVNV